MIQTKEPTWSQANCASGDGETLHLFFSEDPSEIVLAQELCVTCPLRIQCLEGAVARGEPWGVWGGHLFDRGRPIAEKRKRGRPSNEDLRRQREFELELRRDLEDYDLDVEVA